MLSTWRLRPRSMHCSSSDRSCWRARRLIREVRSRQLTFLSWDSHFHSYTCFLLQHSAVSINLLVFVSFSHIWIHLPKIIVLQNLLTGFIDLFSDLFLRHGCWERMSIEGLPLKDFTIKTFWNTRLIRLHWAMHVLLEKIVAADSDTQPSQTHLTLQALWSVSALQTCSQA